MKLIKIFIFLTPIALIGQGLDKEFYDKEYSTNNIVYETAIEIDSLAIGFDFKIEKQYLIITLLKNIAFYEQMIEELNQEKDLNVKKGLIKSVILSDYNLGKLFRETDGVFEISQILKGHLQAMRRLTVKYMWVEYKGFLCSKKNFSD